MTASKTQRAVAPGARPPATRVVPFAERLPAYLLVLLCCALVLALRQRADDPLGVHVDSWTDANIMVSARNVATNGWLTYHLAAQHQVDRPPFKSDPFYYYAHYPLGTYVLNWIAYGLGAQTLSALRWMPALASAAALVLWYLLLCQFLARWTALASTVALGTSFGFLAYADDIHHGYSPVLLLGMMLSYTTAVAARGRRRLLLLAGSWMLLLINAFMSWEWYLWSQIFYWGHAALLGVPFKKRWLLLFATAPLLAFSIQYGHRVMVFGSENGGGIVEDLLRRTIRLEDTGDTPADVTLTTYPQHVAKRFEQFYGLRLSTLWVVALIWGIFHGGLDQTLRGVYPALRWLLLLCLCGVSWWSVMLQHTAVHPHVMRHALFFYALLAGIVLADGLRAIGSARYPLRTRVLSGAAMAVILWPHAGGCYRDHEIHSDPSYRDPYNWSAGWEEGPLLRDLANKLPANAIILTNNNRLPLLRYWTNLPVYPVTLSLHPYARNHAVPGARFQIDLTTSHLRALYGAHLPRLLYVYFFIAPPDSAYRTDPILWQLIDGSWTEPDSPERFTNLRAVVLNGGGTSAHPVVARGSNWVCFDAGALPASLPSDWLDRSPPTRADFGPPR